MPLRRLVALATLLALALSAAPAGTALADATDPVSKATLTDPAGDVARPRGDAVRAQLVHLPTSIDVRLQVAAYADPMTNPSWTAGTSAAVWRIDSLGDNHADWIVTVRHGSGHFIGTVVRESDDAIVCEGEAASSAEERTYSFSFPRSCLDRPLRARFYALMRWDRNPDSTEDEPQVDLVTGSAGANGRFSRWTYAPCATPYSSTLKFATHDTNIDAGALAVFRARIVRKGTDTGIAYQRLELHRRLSGSDLWVVVDARRSDATGRVRLEDSPPRRAFYRAHHPASSCANDLTTPIIEIRVT